MPQAPGQPADHAAANCAENQNWCIRLRYHGVGGAEQHADDNPDDPRGQAQRIDLRRSNGRADHDTDRQTIEKRAEQGRALVGKVSGSIDAADTAP